MKQLLVLTVLKQMYLPVSWASIKAARLFSAVSMGEGHCQVPYCLESVRVQQTGENGGVQVEESRRENGGVQMVG